MPFALDNEAIGKTILIEYQYVAFALRFIDASTAWHLHRVLLAADALTIGKQLILVIPKERIATINKCVFYKPLQAVAGMVRTLAAVSGSCG